MSASASKRWPPAFADTVRGEPGMSLYAWLAATLPLTCHEDDRIMKVFQNDSATAARRLEVLLRCLKARAMLEELANDDLPIDTASGATVRDP